MSKYACVSLGGEIFAKIASNLCIRLSVFRWLGMSLSACVYVFDCVLFLFVLFLLQYIRNCIAKEKKAQLSIKNFRELVPLDKDQFIPPVFSQAASGKLKKTGADVGVVAGL